MKVFAISDLHLSTNQNKPMDIFGGNWEGHFEKISQDWQARVTDEDLVLIAGDISWAIKAEDAQPDLEKIAALSGKKVLVKGNHDYWWNTIGKVRQSLPKNMYALQNDSMKFGNIVLCGSRGWLCPDGELKSKDKRIYEREILRLGMSFDSAKKLRQTEDKLICMMHFPPFNVHRHDSGFTKLIVENDVDAVVYGHLHGKDCRSDLVVNKFGTKFFLTSCDLVDNTLVEIPLD